MAGIGRLLASILIAAVFVLGPVQAIALGAVGSDAPFRVELQGRILDFITPSTGEIIDRWELGKTATAVALDDRGDVIYLGYGDGTVQAVETATQRQRWHLHWFTAPVIALSVWRGDLMAVDTDAGAVILNKTTGAKRPDSPRDPSISFSPRIVGAVLSGRSASIRLADGQTLQYDRLQRRWQMSISRALVPATSGDPQTSYAPYAPPPVHRGGPMLTPGYAAPPTTQYAPAPAPPPVPDLSEILALGRFPWPPPRYSDVHVIDGYRLTASGMRTFEDVARQIRYALTLGRYTAPRHYLIDNGFVVVTQIEEIDESGFPVNPEYERWWNGEAPSPNPFTFSLTGFLNALSSAPVGRYRVIAFALNVGECVSPPCAPRVEIDAATARLLAEGGVPALPNNIRNELILQDRHRLSVLVYAFEKPNKTLPATLSRRLSALTHLRAANILAALP